MDIAFEPTVELYGHVSQTFDTTIHIGTNEIQNYSLHHTLSNTIVADNYLQEVIQMPVQLHFMLSLVTGDFPPYLLDKH